MNVTGVSKRTVSAEDYERLRGADCVHDSESPPPEDALQRLWHEGLPPRASLCLDDGRPLRVLSPGWWNHGEGPDFREAQLEFAGRLRTGDVEIHLTHGAWKQHGHHLDRRYDEVVLVVVLDSLAPRDPPRTSDGRRIPTLLLKNYLTTEVEEIATRAAPDDYSRRAPRAVGLCAAGVDGGATTRLHGLLELAGDWRALAKSRAIRDRAERVGLEQAAYEALLAACGYQRFKRQFRTLAQELPYDRARQLAREDPRLLETAYFRMAGLLPESWPGGEPPPSHAECLLDLARTRFAGLQPLPMMWERVGVRPINYPERRLAGATRFVAKTAAVGLLESLARIWGQDLDPIRRRKAFESLFPIALGFWSEHCAWAGKTLARPAAPLGAGRVRSIIGNVFVPVALAQARLAKDRTFEERVFAFYAALPREPDNPIQKLMGPRVLCGGLKLRFRTQQGLLQLFQDWCEPNPSCARCRVIPYLHGATPPSGAPR